MSAQKKDPSGVPRAVDADRMDKSQNNSGIVVGEESVAVKTTTGQTTDTTQTAFIKVYQDAGVIGVSMLTLLVLCILLGSFCLRLLKLYAAMSVAQDQISSSRTVAVEKLATATLLVQAEVKSLKASLSEFSAEIRRAGSDLRASDLDLSHKLELQSQALVNKLDMISLAMSGGAFSSTHGAEKGSHE